MRWLQGFLLVFLVSAGVCAKEVELVGTLEQAVTVPNVKPSFGKSPDSKVITLLKVALSENARLRLYSRRDGTEDISLQKQEGLGSVPKTELGMNRVPVLDQGSHGTCVTFANTAAIDAVLNRGDYISQLCLLELGHHLATMSYFPSGWDGSWGRIVLSQMEEFGIVSKAEQRARGCGGLIEYPLRGAEPDTDMSLLDYHQASEPLNDQLVSWSTLLDTNQAFEKGVEMNAVLSQVKASLTAGDRLTFGVLLVDYNQGVVGALGKYHVGHDTWVLTPEIAADIQDPKADFAGHEMIITGYDDTAVAVDAKGRSHRGLLTLRNSWGMNVGDQGNFYMSYDYFKALVMEVQRIRHIGS